MLRYSRNTDDILAPPFANQHINLPAGHARANSRLLSYTSSKNCILSVSSVTEPEARRRRVAKTKSVKQTQYQNRQDYRTVPCFAPLRLCGINKK